ncbi:MAG: tetraacyldisaccharide 4'-kinase [Deltaproteobacteria bacterium]|nr:tetraacyldisaccharide 4'-kinase [Deltaproteobacteria bacterium]
MTDDGKGCFPSFAWFLYTVSLCYQFLSNIRTALYEKGIFRAKKMPCTVISIGNLVAGGTGKTPMTIYLAELVKKNGNRPVVISRGYRGGAEKSGGIVCDGKSVLMDAGTAGDEPYMMAKTLKDVPILVGSNRLQSCSIALQKFNPDLIILDDAFQHLKLFRDIDIVLLDHSKPLGNQRFLPRGPLREPVSALKRGSVFITTRSRTSSVNWPKELDAVLNGKPIFFTTHRPYVSSIEFGITSVLSRNINTGDQLNMDVFKGKKAYLFSGIVRNSDFRASILEYGCIEVGFSEFPDHHFYSPKEMETIFHNAEKTGAEMLVTTEKDFVRISKAISWPVDIIVVGVKISFKEDSSLFDSFINKNLK